MDVKAISRNPKDSMKSTWRYGDRAKWGIAHWLTHIFDTYPDFADKKPRVFSKKDSVPYTLQWRLHVWILIHALSPIALHCSFTCLTGYSVHPFAAFFFYTWVMVASTLRQIQQFRGLGLVYGYLDGDVHERDGIPDVAVTKVVIEDMAAINVRILMATILTYRGRPSPASINWLVLPLEVGLYSWILDFWFYWYHRLMHEIPGLWKYHRTHHLSKHPNTSLAPYADHEQEVLDILGIPLLTYCTLKLLGFPMGFYDWWICTSYVIFGEIAGHSGLRTALVLPSPLSWLLRLVDAELIVEDHDIHHRKGWRKSFNYGKQTRLWDRIFGTCTERIEGFKSNIDYDSPLRFPLY